MNVTKAAVLGFIANLFAVVVIAQVQRDVDLKASDGTALRGSYFAAKKPGRGIILLHQCNRERHSWNELALRLSEKGFHVMTLDYRGFGESGGEPHNSLPAPERQVLTNEKWPGDIDLAVAYLINQSGVDKNRIGAGGASCGVNQSIQLAKRNPSVKSLVLLSGPANQQALEFLRTSPELPLFASAADDDGGAVQTMQWILGFSRSPNKKFLHYTSGGHGADLFPFQPDLIPAIVQWFEATLASAPLKAAGTKAELAPTPVEEFWSVLHQPGGAARASEMFREARKKDPEALGFPENEVNALGYERLQAGNSQEAIEIFRLNVAAYPNSPNVYDSLADAYAAAGQNDQAKEYAQQAINLLEKDRTIPEQFKGAIRESAMQKLQPAEKTQNTRPSNSEIVKMPIVLKVPGMDQARIKKDILYKSIEGTDLKMDIYAPPNGSTKFPVVLFISGGGNQDPSPKDWGVYQTYGRLMAASGIAAVQFNKRFERSPESLRNAESDILDLIAYLRQNADSLHLDLNRIGVAAFSAGGRLLAPFLRSSVPGVKCIASMYGVMTAGDDGSAEFSPYAQLGRNGQKLPIFIGRAGQDGAALNGGIDAFAREAIAKGFELQLINHSSGRHGFDIIDDNERSREVIKAFVAFLQDNLKESSQHAETQSR